MAQLQELLGISLPIIQAPMAGAQGSAMAISVCNAGGLGSIPCAMLSTDSMRSELASIRTATDRPINVNFFCHNEPVANQAAIAKWRARLAPYYHELGVDTAGTSSGANAGQRQPSNRDAADAIAVYNTVHV